jgi:hypothetical protein
VNHDVLNAALVSSAELEKFLKRGSVCRLCRLTGVLELSDDAEAFSAAVLVARLRLGFEAEE